MEKSFPGNIIKTFLRFPAQTKSASGTEVCRLVKGTKAEVYTY
jgi:hypothetical protein